MMSTPLRAFSTSLHKTQHFSPGLREVTLAIPNKKPRKLQAKQAFDQVKSGDSIFVAGSAATPSPLLKALSEVVKERGLDRIKLHSIHLQGEPYWLAPDVRGRIRSNCLFTGANQVKAVNEGHADFNSVFLNDIPSLFRRRVLPLDVALIQVSPPDENGFCSLGVSVDIVRSAISCSRVIIALSNSNMPRTLGESTIHSSQIDVLVEDNDHQLFSRIAGEPSEQEASIGRMIAEHLVPDGATLQTGIGSIPDAALAAMANHKDLGVHTEMFSDGILPLVHNNVITNRLKPVHTGKIVTSFIFGSPDLYRFVHDNPLFHFGEVSWTNDPAFIRRMPNMVAINAAVEVDLTGQVVSDSVGERFLSGFGGQLDFIRGAAISDDGKGKAIIAIPSVTKNGQSKIVPTLKKGAGVVTGRGHVHYIVTEYGIANLWGRNMRQRAFDLIRISHPDHREGLEKAAFERLKVMPSSD